MIVNSAHDVIDYTDMFLPAIDASASSVNGHKGKQQMTKKAAAPPAYSDSHYEDDYSEDFEQESKNSHQTDVKGKLPGGTKSQGAEKGDANTSHAGGRGQQSLSPKKPAKTNENNGSSLSPRKQVEYKTSNAIPSESFKEPVKPQMKAEVSSHRSHSKGKKSSNNNGSPVYKNSKDVGFVKNMSPHSQQTSPERFLSHDIQLDKTITKTAMQLQQYAQKKQSQKEKQLDAVLSYNVDNMDDYLQEIHNKYIYHIAAWKIAYFVQLCRSKKAFTIIMDMTQKIGELKQAYKRSQTKGREAQLYIQKLLDNIQEAQNQEEDFKDERDELIIAINSKNSEIFQLQQLHSGARDNEVQNLQMQLDLTKKTVQDLVVNNAKLQVYLEDTKSSEQEKDSEIDGLNNIISDSRKQLDYYKNELKLMIDAEQAAKSSTTTREVELKKENETLASLLAQHRQQEAIYGQEIVYLKRAVDHEKDNYAAERAKGEKIKSDSHVLQNYLAEIALDIQTGKDEIRRKSADVVKLEARIEELLVSMEGLNTDISGYKFVLNTDREMIQQQQDTIESLTRDLSTKIAFIDSLQLPEKNVLVEQIQSLTNALSEKDAKIDNLNNELASKVVVVEALIRDMKSDRSKHQVDVESLSTNSTYQASLSPVKLSATNQSDKGLSVHVDSLIAASAEGKGTVTPPIAGRKNVTLDNKDVVMSRMDELESRLLLLMTSIESKTSDLMSAAPSPSKFVASIARDELGVELKVVDFFDDFFDSDAKAVTKRDDTSTDVVVYIPVDEIDSARVSTADTSSAIVSSRETVEHKAPSVTAAEASATTQSSSAGAIAPQMMVNIEPILNASNLLSSSNSPGGFDFSLVNTPADSRGAKEDVKGDATSRGADTDPATNSPIDAMGLSRELTFTALEKQPSKRELKEQNKALKADRKALRAKKREERAARRADRASKGLAPLDADKEEEDFEEGEDD